MEMKSGNLVFTFNSSQHSALPVGFREPEGGEETDRRPYIFCYPPPGGLHAKVVSPHLINLEAMRTLELELNSGYNNIKSGTIRVRPATAGLRLRIAETEVVDGELDLAANNDSGVIEFTKLPSQSFVRLRIPYTVEETFTTLSARAEVGYDTEKGRFAFSTVHSVVATLPISVNVQDVFKDELLFSRFTISPAMLIPLRITQCNLPSSEAYEVQSSITGLVALDVFPKQPASLLYKIRPLANNTTKRSLRLRVDFSCVDDECFDAIEKLFTTAVEASPFAQYATLLTSHLVASFRAQLSTADLEVIGLVREVDMLPYTSVRWDDLLAGLKQRRTDDIRQWLMTWHEVSPLLIQIGAPLNCALTITDVEQPCHSSPATPIYPHSQHNHSCRDPRNPSCSHCRVPAPSQQRRQRLWLLAHRRRPDDLSRAMSPSYTPLVHTSQPRTRGTAARMFI